MYTDVRGLSGLLARTCEALLILLPLAVIGWWCIADALLALLFAGMVWVMAAVTARGRALAEENASFV